MMRFSIETLVDITETRARKGQDEIQYGQQQNFMTLINTLGLRCNVNTVGSPKLLNKLPTTFGSDYKNKQNVWQQIIEVEYEGATSIDMMLDDFDLVPVITGLQETVEFDVGIFRTKDAKKKNITFELLQND